VIRAVAFGALVLAAAWPCLAQEKPLLTRLAEQHRDCVYASAVEQRIVQPDKNMAVEQAFLACGTEEAAILAAMRANMVAPDQANILISRHKLRLKRELQRFLP
jgi:hypothetical protein